MGSPDTGRVANERNPQKGRNHIRRRCVLHVLLGLLVRERLHCQAACIFLPLLEDQAVNGVRQALMGPISEGMQRPRLRAGDRHL